MKGLRVVDLFRGGLWGCDGGVGFEQALSTKRSPPASLR